MGETAIKQEQICTGTGIAGGAFAQDGGALVGLRRGQALDGARLYGTAEVPEQSCANEPVRGPK